ncbi:hypothetical protein EVG20_g7174 [Dentipellis fragilis]|uniref:USP8 dimerisation domain-containing protein n=1 Tax=Dentipellis fragilis TaxID=205917 RepID=A0A4Y9YHQ3_9AGAM|nr:hypothetical protein EVG20_g7174 [Dentipellis fragilis]
MTPSASSPYAQSSSRPPSIAELADRAKADSWDPQRPLKHWLRTAEHLRSSAKQSLERGDLESAFVEFARAARIVLEKMPTHEDYKVLLNAQQRHNMGLHGQEILDSLGEVKQALLERYEAWQEQEPSTSTSPYPAVYSRGYPDASPGATTPLTPSSGSASTPSSYRSRGNGKARTPSPYRKTLEDEENARRAREDAMRRDEEQQRRRHAAKQQEEWARAEQRRIERAIARRQQEAEAAAQAARSGAPLVNVPPPQAQQPPPPQQQLAMPVASTANTRAPVFTASLSEGGGPVLQMPLESPTRRQTESAPRPARTPILPPITTTSPPPASMGSIQYPSLMSQHQIAQGYTPSLGSMFHQPGGRSAQNSGLLLMPDASSSAGGPL